MRQKYGGGGRAIEKEEEAIPKRKRKEQVSRNTVQDRGEKSRIFFKKVKYLYTSYGKSEFGRVYVVRFLGVVAKLSAFAKK